MTRAVKNGAILYLDEVVEARKDTTVLIHPLTDHRRILPVEKTGSIIEADDRFLLCISYNPHYQSALKDLKPSTRQRFISIEFYFPPRDIEAEIVERESGCSAEVAMSLARLGEKIRNLQEHGLQESASTRLLIYAGRLMAEGISARRACQVAIVWTLTDELRVATQYRRGGFLHIRVEVSMTSSPPEIAKEVLARRVTKPLADPSLKPAAVLLVLYPKDGQYCILLHKRSERVEYHKGEISFPGGAKDQEDRDSLDTALRETEEEMGIRREDVTIIGELDEVATRSGFGVRVYVGTIDYPYPFKPSNLEVAEILEVPIFSIARPRSTCA